MIATGWRDGGSGFGIRVGKGNARQFFEKDWEAISVQIDDEVFEFPLRSTFWTTCPEFRGAAIGRWLGRNGLTPWQKGRPPVVELVPLGGRRYRLSLPADRG